MNVSVSLFSITNFNGNRMTPEAITAKETTAILGIDMLNGFVTISKDTWMRIEAYMNILQAAEITSNNKDIEGL